MNKPISIAIELPDDFTAWELAQFIKRVRFDQAYEITEAHLPQAERTDKAHAMLRGLIRVGDALKDVRISPR